VVDADVVSRRILALNEALEELKRPGAGDARTLLADRLLCAAVERWLQIAINACVDIAHHVVADRGWTPPESARLAFAALVAHGLLVADLGERLGRAAGLRNILVHDYVAVDVEQLAATVRNDLDDLRAFGAKAAEWMPAP
jgi:uncharacterized protein YutE (UPF0331/DUF86 family)